MAAVFTLDSIILAALAIVAVFIVAVVMTTPPGALPRFVRGCRYHRSGRARHAAEPVAAPMPVLETVPDAPVSPFAPRTFA